MTLAADFADIFLDTLFLEPFSVLRRDQSINQYGVASETSTEITLWGNIQPDSVPPLERRENYTNSKDNINVYTRSFNFRSAEKNTYPDIVKYKGNLYEVKATKDYSYGADGGYYMAYAELTTTMTA